MNKLYIDEFFYKWAHATDWEDLPQKEKKKAIKRLKRLIFK